MNRPIEGAVLENAMKTSRAMLLGAISGITALTVSSCVYDPYYTSSSYSSGYGDGYGNGYGYGGSGFSTSFFVTTGRPRWGYDPYARCYYDYHRRSYYDPFLAGYYPVGYRPRHVAGAPHPHNWDRSHNRISPPSRIRSYSLQNYQDRRQRYQNLDHDWSQNLGPGSGSSRQKYRARQEPTPSFQNRGYDRNGSFERDRRQQSIQGRSSTSAPDPSLISRRGGFATDQNSQALVQNGQSAKRYSERQIERKRESGTRSEDNTTRGRTRSRGEGSVPDQRSGPGRGGLQQEVVRKGNSNDQTLSRSDGRSRRE